MIGYFSVTAQQGGERGDHFRQEREIGKRGYRRLGGFSAKRRRVEERARGEKNEARDAVGGFVRGCEDAG